MKLRERATNLTNLIIYRNIYLYWNKNCEEIPILHYTISLLYIQLSKNVIIKHVESFGEGPGFAGLVAARLALALNRVDVDILEVLGSAPPTAVVASLLQSLIINISTLISCIRGSH